LRRNANLDTDVIVLGGGPAGGATTLGLTRRGYAVTLIERSDYKGPRVGETLPPAVRPLLISLGLWDQFLREKPAPSFGIRSAWGQDDLRDNDSIFNPYGPGWHVDRARFDAMLARSAERAGARVWRGARLASCTENNAGWQIDVECGGRPRRLWAKFVVDATGRASSFGRRQGAKRVFIDRLVGIVAFVSRIPSEPASNSFTVVEAVKDGWWYYARLPHSRLVLAYMTDADLCPRGTRALSSYWRCKLQETRHLPSVARNALGSHPVIVAANSSRLDRVAGKNWLAVGDAAMALDPLSSQGIYKALDSGWRAAQTLHALSSGGPVALQEYGLDVKDSFASYLRARQSYYNREQRWPTSLFWQRRQSAHALFGRDQVQTRHFMRSQDEPKPT